jgi:hypothetical protein
LEGERGGRGGGVGGRFAEKGGKVEEEEVGHLVEESKLRGEREGVCMELSRFPSVGVHVEEGRGGREKNSFGMSTNNCSSM